MFGDAGAPGAKDSLGVPSGGGWGGRSLRPWLAEEGSFPEVVASLPGGAVLAQVLPALLAMEPATTTMVPPPGINDVPDVPGVAGVAGMSDVAGVSDAAGVRGVADVRDVAGVVDVADVPDVAGVADVPDVPDGADVFVAAAGGIALGGGPGGGLPVWVAALHQCLQSTPIAAAPNGSEWSTASVPAGVPSAAALPAGVPSAAALRAGVPPAEVGSAPVRSDRVAVGGLVDPGQVERDDERADEALAAMPIAAVVEVVAGFKRIEAWAAAQAARAAARLASRPELRPDVTRPVPAGAAKSAALRAPALAATTLAKRLGTSERTAGLLVHTGLALNGPLYATGVALDRGVIDWSKAQVIAGALAGIPWQVAHEVEDKVLPTAPTRTPGKLRHDLAKALLEVDPDDAAGRHDRARRERRVERPVPLPDGMALVRAVLPADAATRLDATLQAAAKGAKAAGDPRTIDQLRADALDTLAVQAWHAGAIDARGCPSPEPDAAAVALADLLGPAAQAAPRNRMKLSHTGKRAQLNVTIDLTTLLGLTEIPGHLAGYGPISADMARRLSRDATWRRLITDPVNGLVVDVATKKYRPPANLDELVRLRYPTCIDPVCAVPSDRCDTDHHAAWTAANPDTSAGNLGPLCRTHHLHKTHAGADYRETAPGVHEITTPTGHRYRAGTEGTARPGPAPPAQTAIPERTGPPGGSPPPGDPPF